jgi:hypothetical protein
MSALATAAAPPASRPELDQLQGVWMSVAGPREARLLVAGSRFSFEFVGGDVYMGTLDLVDSQMTMHIEEGPTEFRGQQTLCLYRVEGDVLRWCPGRPGSGRKPTAFPSVDDPRYLSLVFRHARRRGARA